MWDSVEERNEWVNVLKSKEAAAKGEDFDADKFREMEEEEIKSPDAKRRINFQESPNIAEPSESPKKTKKDKEVENIEDDFESEHENIEEELKDIDNQFNTGGIDFEEDEEKDEREENAKNLEIGYTDLKKLINQYLDHSNDLLKRKIEKEEKAWDMKFQNYWTNLIDFELEFNKSQDDPEVSNTHVKVYWERLLQHVGKFREECIRIFETVVDEMIVPESQKNLHSYDAVPSEYKAFLTDDDLEGVEIFIEKNIIFRVVASDMELNSKWKMYKREFNSMDVFFDTLYILSKDEERHQLRVPLSCILDYKGFRWLAIGIIPLDEYSLRLGLNIDNNFVHDPVFKKVLSDSGEILGLKEVKWLFRGLAVHENIPISTHIKVYVYQKGDNSDDNHRDSPTNKSKEHHFFELQYEVKKNQDLGYVMNTKYMYPLDSELNEIQANYERFLRPEFLSQYEKPLKADTKKPPPNGVENRYKEDQDILEINEASKILQQKIIPNLANLFDSLTLIPLNSKSLSETFHSYGVNMRYLGKVALYSNLYHVQDAWINEMIVRQLKQLLNAQISAWIREFQSDVSNTEVASFRHPPVHGNLRSIMKNSASDRNLKLNLKGVEKSVGFNDGYMMNVSADRPRVDYLDDEPEYGTPKIMNDKTEEWYRDFLNLWMGNDDETKEFYHEVVYPRVRAYYNYPLDKLMEYEVNRIALYYGLIYHWGIRILNEDEIFERIEKRVEKPFNKENIVRWYTRYKVYPMRSLPIHNFANQYKDYRAQGQNEIALNACKAKIHYTKLLEGIHDQDAQSEIAELLLEEGMYEDAIEEAKIGLSNCEHENSQAIKFYWVLMRAYQGLDLTNDAQTYFDKALSCLVHHWGQLHPLHLIIYNIMAFLMIENGSLLEAEYLYKSSLSWCSKVLGPNHIQTAEVYMDIGRLYLKMHSKHEALVNFQAAFYIYQSYFGKQSIPSANAAFHIASIMEEHNRLGEACEFALIASDAYSKINGQMSDLAISSLWLVISISYSLRSPKINEFSVQLFDIMVKRDEDIKEKEGLENEDEETKERIDTIKEYLVATVIMNTTRNLEDDKRRDLKSYCELVINEEDKENDFEIGNELRGYNEDEAGINGYRHKGVDARKASNVWGLKFSKEQSRLLRDIYDAVKDSKYKSIHDFYYDKIKDVVHANLLTEENGGYGGIQRRRNDTITSSKPCLDCWFCISSE
jgi:hypothetical protein